MNCEFCDRDITNGEKWGLATTPIKDGFPQIHYYCSEEHAKEGEKKLDYKVVGEIIDV